MLSELYLRNRLVRQIQWNGRDFEFFRMKTDEYGQVSDAERESYKIRGIFHDGGGYGGMLYLDMYENDSARTLSKMKPMILCAFKPGEKIRTEDLVDIGGRRYRVAGKNDVNAFGVVWEVTLEVLDYVMEGHGT